MTCKVCNKECSSLSTLHRHLTKEHSLSQSDYYHSYNPRYDLQSRDLIDYKDYNQYHQSDFNGRESFADWLADNYKDEKTKEYCLCKIKERMTKKTVTTLPSHVELKSLMLPSCHGFERIYGSMENFSKAMKLAGVDLRFDYTSIPELHSGHMKIYIDSREQAPLPFLFSEKMKLSVGDYVPDEHFYSDVYVDRKSLPDLAGTLSAGRDRVEREIQRAADLGFYVIFVVEDLYSNVMNYSSANSFSKKLTGAHLLHSIRELMSQYNNIQFVCAGSRTRAVEVIENIFRLKEKAKTFDLELLKDRGVI